MSIHDFYSKLKASDERNPLFQALYALSRMPDLRPVLATTGDEEEEEMRDWAIWNDVPDGQPPALRVAVPA